MNGRSSCCTAARNFSLLRHFLRCERTQHKLRIYRMGSKPTLLRTECLIEEAMPSLGPPVARFVVLAKVMG